MQKKEIKKISGSDVGRKRRRGGRTRRGNITQQEDVSQFKSRNEEVDV